MVMTRPRRTFGIIGGGPAGIACAVHLKRRGYEDVVIFDRQNSIGGLWVHDAAGPVYTGLRTVTSVPTMGFFGHKPRSLSGSAFTSGEAIRELLLEVACDFELNHNFRGGHDVVAVVPGPDGWTVSTADGASFLFEKVILATGTEQQAYVPESWRRHPRASHSSVITPEHIKESRYTVLLGCATSAATLACDAVAEDSGRRVVLAVPNEGRWVVPTMFDGLPTDLPVGQYDSSYLAQSFDRYLETTRGFLSAYLADRLPTWTRPNHPPYARAMLISHDLDRYVAEGRIALASDEQLEEAVRQAELIVLATGFVSSLGVLLPRDVTERLHAQLPPRLICDGTLGWLRLPNTDLGGLSIFEELARVLIDAIVRDNCHDMGVEPSMPLLTSTFVFGADLLRGLQASAAAA
jgi:hypothetical protein